MSRTRKTDPIRIREARGERVSIKCGGCNYCCTGTYKRAARRAERAAGRREARAWA